MSEGIPFTQGGHFFKLNLDYYRKKTVGVDKNRVLLKCHGHQQNMGSIAHLKKYFYLHAQNITVQYLEKSTRHM